MKELIILDEVFCPDAIIGGETKIEDLSEGQYEITVSVNKTSFIKGVFWLQYIVFWIVIGTRYSRKNLYKILVLYKKNKEDKYVDKSWNYWGVW